MFSASALKLRIRRWRSTETATAFTSSISGENLPFRIGYNVAVGETNLQVLYKKK